MLFHHLQKRILLTTCFVIVFILYISNPSNTLAILSTHFYYYLYPEKGIQCYHAKSETLPDIAESSPMPGRSIFFHETSCNSHFNGKIFITARQACAVESAARLNPNWEVHLLYASPGVFKFEGTESDRLLQSLLRYENIKMHHIDYEKYTKGTPVEHLYTTGQIDGSGYPQSHASDVLRYLTLWKYGGIYLDLDVVVIKSLEDLRLNFAGSESHHNVAAGVLSFSPSGLGHTLARLCLEDLKENFKRFDWGYNGPGVITRLLQKICEETEAKNMINKDCRGFNVYPTDYFYAVPWWNWTMYFDEEAIDAVLTASKRSYIIHVWNKHSIHTRIPVKTKTPYLVFANKYCPRVMEQCDQYF